MVLTKQLNIKNRTYHFYNDLINIKDFDPKLGKKTSMSLGIYYISYATKKPCSLINSINSFNEEKEGDKYLNCTYRQKY